MPPFLQFVIRRFLVIPVSLDEVTSDLAWLVKKYPREAQIWQIVGNTLDRMGDADHAAQSYDQTSKLRQ